MPKLIFRCNYLKNALPAYLENYINYIRTREVMEQSDTIERLQEKASDLERLERYFGREQVQTIVGTVKGIRTGRNGK